jgi:shikimate dehydrogenase
MPSPPSTNLTPTVPAPLAHYGVLGNPIAHSRSPSIHTDFAQQCGLALCYERVLVPISPPQAFAEQVQALQNQGWKGVNVTVPFKHQAYAVANSHSQAAQCAQVANTLVFTPAGIHAHNTDGAGLCSDLGRLLALQGIGLHQCRVVLLGAGGAAAGCIQALCQAQVQSLVVLNRTLERAQALAQRAQALGVQAEASLLSQSPQELQAVHAGPGGPWVLINATAASLAGHSLPLNPAWYAQAVLAYDMMYAANATPWLQAVQAVEAQHPSLVLSDGLGMLVFQAAHAFTLWTGQYPDALATLQRMRAAL